MSLDPVVQSDPAPAQQADVPSFGTSHDGQPFEAKLSELTQLEARFPAMSARHLKTSTLVRWSLLLIASVNVAAFIAPQAAIYGIAALVALAFVCITLLRLAGIREVVSQIDSRGSDRIPDKDRKLREDAPRYAVLVALYQEATVIGQLLEALKEIDYPTDRLQISLIVEANDLDTRKALAAHQIPDHMRIVVVPDGIPRTKPRALNYALASAVGDYVVVYDAEDVPEPDQLHRAVSLLETDREQLGCVQARLGIYNPSGSFFTRQFTLEYGALFKAILPALERFGLPVPLGGTSNHFPGLLAQMHQIQ